jgi:SAM-dependent methyltransferase
MSSIQPREPAVVAPDHADYGLDAPGFVRGALVGGALGVLLGQVLMRQSSSRAVAGLGVAASWTGLSFVITSGLMVLSSRFGKLRARDRLLDRLDLDPTGVVLDVGCGHGLLLLGAAKRVPEGRAVGLDIWSQRDQGKNSREATLANAAAEGVLDRVELRDGDMREMPFADATFDAVVSSLAIHNVSGSDQRRQAIREIARVLKPGGQVALMDIRYVGDYATTLRASGFREVATHGITPWIYPPTRVLTARK